MCRYDAVSCVAAFGFDLIGTTRLGLAALWHNRAGPAPPRVPAPLAERRTLAGLMPFLD